jgi:hypothetical protein
VTNEIDFAVVSLHRPNPDGSAFLRRREAMRRRPAQIFEAGNLRKALLSSRLRGERGPQWLLFDQDVHECVYVKGRDESSQSSLQQSMPVSAAEQAREATLGVKIHMERRERERECGAKPPL